MGALTTKDVRVKAKERTYDGHFKIDRYHLSHTKFDGGETEPFFREIFERGHAVAVLLVDPDTQHIVFIEQFRAGALAAGWDSPWLTEIVAGIIDAGESPEDVARRETEEESGCKVLDLIKICEYLVSPGGTSETIHLYCAQIDSTNAGGVFGLDHEHEDIRVFTRSFDDALGDLKAGVFDNSAILIAMQWFALNKDDLLAHWRFSSN